MQPFRCIGFATRIRLAVSPYHARMPSRPGTTPSPLSGLPRPLADRERRGPVGRRALTIGLLVGLIGAMAFFLLSSWGSGPFAPVDAIAGAAQSPDPAGAALAAAAAPSEPAVDGGTGPAAPTATPTPTPTPTATPVPTPAPLGTLTGYQWPLPNGRLTLPFGPTPWGSRIVAGEPFHDGADLATFCGDRVVAAHDGTVLAAGRHYDHMMGWVGDLQPYLDRLEKKKLYATLPIVVVIDDGNGYRSIYAHFSKISVKKGQVVKAGQFLGLEGMTGRASGCHLHYGLFSPLETETFAMDPKVAKRMKLPAAEIARIDPLLVLPHRPTATPTVTTPP
jgi:murein DD-endopeptidase MepM/ murein hydrolase activator NlpD